MAFTLNTIFDHNRYSLAPMLFNTTDDMKKLNNLKSTLKKDDFIMTWWDYGWLLWYYTNNKNTLIDNGKHQQDPKYFLVITKHLQKMLHYFLRKSIMRVWQKAIQKLWIILLKTTL